MTAGEEPHEVTPVPAARKGRFLWSMIRRPKRQLNCAALPPEYLDLENSQLWGEGGVLSGLDSEFVVFGAGVSDREDGAVGLVDKRGAAVIDGEDSREE